MKILLIYPHKPERSMSSLEDIAMLEPLGLEYLAATIDDKEHETEIYDMRVEKNLNSKLKKYKPDIVGVTGISVHINVIKKICSIVKCWNKDAVTMVGGYHATLVPEEYIDENIDVIVRGEGVFIFKEIVNRISLKKDFSNINGVWYKKNEKVIRNEYAIENGIDDAPLPRRDLVKKYLSKYHCDWFKPVALMRTSKGCPARCSFCTQWKLTNGRYMKRNPEKIVEELKTLESNYVYFADDESFIDPNRMIELANAIKKAGIKKKYFAYIRCDNVIKDVEILKLWKEIGLERVFVGLEFHTDDNLNDVKKGCSASDNEKAIKILNDLKINIYPNLIVKSTFSKEEFKGLADYCRKFKLQYVTFTILTPLQCTTYFDDVKDELQTKDLELFDYFHSVFPTVLPIKTFYKEFYKLYTRSVPVKEGIAFLLKFPLLELPGVTLQYLKLLFRLKSLHRDHEKSKCAKITPLIANIN